MKRFFGYLRTIRNYWESPKGRFDVLDYGKGIGFFVVMAGLAFLLVGYLF